MQFLKNKKHAPFTAKRIMPDCSTDYATVGSYNNEMAINLDQFQEGTVIITREEAAEFFGFKIAKAETDPCRFGCPDALVITYDDFSEDGTVTEIKNCAECGKETRKRTIMRHL